MFIEILIVSLSVCISLWQSVSVSLFGSLYLYLSMAVCISLWHSVCFSLLLSRPHPADPLLSLRLPVSHALYLSVCLSVSLLSLPFSLLLPHSVCLSLYISLPICIKMMPIIVYF